MTTDICGKGYVSAFCVPPHHIDDIYIGINKPSTFFTEAGRKSVARAFRRAGSSRPKFVKCRRRHRLLGQSASATEAVFSHHWVRAGRQHVCLRFLLEPPSLAGRTLFESPQAKY